MPGLKAQVRNRLTEINPNLMIVHYESFAEQVQRAFSQQAMIVQLTSLFGILALILAVIGLYGVTAYAVAQRTGEIGIRLALGANRMDMQRMVLRDAFLQVAMGLAIGIPCAIETGHLSLRRASAKTDDLRTEKRDHQQLSCIGFQRNACAATLFRCPIANQPDLRCSRR